MLGLTYKTSMAWDLSVMMNTPPYGISLSDQSSPNTSSKFIHCFPGLCNKGNRSPQTMFCNHSHAMEWLSRHTHYWLSGS